MYDVEMPISPSDLEWWGWLLCALGGAIVTAIAALFSEDGDNVAAVLIAIAAGIATMICAGIGIIRFAKWAWAG